MTPLAVGARPTRLGEIGKVAGRLHGAKVGEMESIELQGSEVCPVAEPVTVGIGGGGIGQQQSFFRLREAIGVGVSSGNGEGPCGGPKGTPGAVPRANAQNDLTALGKRRHGGRVGATCGRQHGLREAQGMVGRPVDHGDGAHLACRHEGRADGDRVRGCCGLAVIDRRNENAGGAGKRRKAELPHHLYHLTGGERDIAVGDIGREVGGVFRAEET